MEKRKSEKEMERKMGAVKAGLVIALIVLCMFVVFVWGIGNTIGIITGDFKPMQDPAGDPYFSDFAGRIYINETPACSRSVSIVFSAGGSLTTCGDDPQKIQALIDVVNQRNDGEDYSLILRQLNYLREGNFP